MKSAAVATDPNGNDDVRRGHRPPGAADRFRRRTTAPEQPGERRVSFKFTGGACDLAFIQIHCIGVSTRDGEPPECDGQPQRSGYRSHPGPADNDAQRHDNPHSKATAGGMLRLELRSAKRSNSRRTAASEANAEVIERTSIPALARRGLGGFRDF